MKTSATVIITFTLLAVLLFVGNVSAEVLAESPHPYANNYDHTWTITDPTATQMRIHFQNITLAGGSDRIRLYDGHSGLPVTYWSTDNGNDIWSEWFTTNAIDVQLTTDSGSTAYGFLVDQKEVRTGATCPPTNPTALAESCHPYANNYDYTWTISNPGATQMRVHFQRITLSIGDDIGLYDSNNTLLATYDDGDNGLNIWSQWYPTDTIKVRFTTGWTENNWGFLVDQMDSQPPASITNLHNTTYQPTSITWNWTDPTSSNFMYARVFINDVFQADVPKGVQSYTATPLTSSTAYTIKINTEGPVGQINPTWVTNTATTSPLPPLSINTLGNTTYLKNSITWTWNDPSTPPDLDHVQIFINGVEQTPVAKGIGLFMASGLTPNTSYTIGTRTVGPSGVINATWVNKTAWTALAPPASITNLTNTTYLQNSITWTWTDPASVDFNRVRIYINNVLQTPPAVAKGVQTFNATGLTPNTQYNISTRTIGNTGLVNATWVNHTAWTAPAPPLSINSLGNTTYQPTYIRWTWNDPVPTTDFDHVQVYLNGVEQTPVAKGIGIFNATGLTPNTSYELGTRTVGPSGVINATWVNKTAWTALAPPASITNLHNTTYQPTSITWNWTDPTSSDFMYARVFINDVFQQDVAKGVQTYTATPLTTSTAYTIKINTEGPVGVINATWVTNTASTSPLPPLSINSLGNTTYQPTYIRWTWNDPSTPPDFDHVQVFLNGVEQTPVAKGIGIFNATGLAPNTSYTIGTRTVGPSGVTNQTWVNKTAWTALAPPVPPASITNLHNTTYLLTSITWNWTDPTSSDFMYARVFLNDVFQQDVAKGVQTFTKTGLTPSTAYTLKINTEGPVGYINATWVSNTSTTAPLPPSSISSLGNTTYQPTYITWAWNDPSTPPDFDHVQVFLNGVEQTPVAKGIGIFNATGLTPNTSYELGTRTVGPSGVINQNWVNNTSKTATAPPVPPASITNLHNTTYLLTSITWNWTDPTSSDFMYARVFLNDVFQQDVAKGVQTFTKTGLTPSTAYTLKINTEGPVGYINATWVSNTSTTAPLPPSSISSLGNTTYQPTYITWAWNDPSTPPDFDHVQVFLNGVEQTPVAKGIGIFNATGLTPNTSYELGTRTVGPSGVINQNWINNTSKTAPASPVPVPPASITNLHNTTYEQTTITWNWTDPSSAGYMYARVFLNDVFQQDVAKGVQTFTKTGLTPSTAYTLKINTEGPVGYINATWVSNTSTTAPVPPVPVPPASITNLHNTTYEQTTITWNWTDPSSAGYTNARVFLNGVFQADVLKGVQTFTKTGLTPSTAYTLSINTEGPIGLINATMVTNTSTTAPVPPVPVPPASVTNLHNTTYLPTSITWDWTNPSSAGFDYVRVYLNGVEQSPVLNGNHIYTATGLTPSTAYTLGIKTVGTNGQINATMVTNTSTTAPVVPPVPVPPASITNLHNTTYQPTTITWNWTDPSSAGYTNARVFLNGVFQADVLKGVQTFTKTGLTPSTAYTLSINTEGPIGLINATWVTNTSTTAPGVPPVPPASITNLHNTTYQPTTITWNWTDPSSAGYTNARVFLNGVFQADVLKGVQTFTKTGLTPSTAYTLSINTEGPIGLINATWVTNTSTTAPGVPPVPPASITNLHNTTYLKDSITWTWTDPSSAGYTNARVFLNGVFQADVLKGVQTFTKTGLTPSTAYTLSINTEGPIGLINATMVTNTSTTAPGVPPVPVPPAIITNLHNTTYLKDSITWNWTDSSSADFGKVMVYLNGVFKGNVTKGTQAYTATGLNASTAYTIGTRTVGTTGLINATWVNSTATTASGVVPPVIVPVARFTANPWSGPAPVTVHFSVLTPGAAETYLWVFGDGTTSTEMNPVHTYSSPAYYRVTLTVSNAAGSSIARGYVFAGRSSR